MISEGLLPVSGRLLLPWSGCRRRQRGARRPRSPRGARGVIRLLAARAARPFGPPSTPGGSWSVSFTEGGPELPPARELSRLGSWLDLEGDAYKKFSGTARYTLNFERPRGGAGDWVLDLGRVAESARVRLNGRELGTLIASPFRVRVPASLLRARNSLEVSVSSLALNRVIDMERRGAKYKRFYNTNFPARRPENRGDDGLFDATKLAARDSGLLGPVTLTPVEPLRF